MVESLWAFVITFSRLNDLYKVYPFQAFRSGSILLIFHCPVLRYTSCSLIIESWGTVRAPNDIFPLVQYGGSDDWWELSSVQVLNLIKCLLVFLFNTSSHCIVHNHWTISSFIRASDFIFSLYPSVNHRLSESDGFNVAFMVLALPCKCQSYNVAP